MTIAVTDKAARAGGRMSAFLVERGTPGFSVTRQDTTIGSAAILLADLLFDDCVVPDDALLGQAGQGFAIAMGSLTNGRLGVSSACVGAADRLLELSIARARQRSTFGEPLAGRQAIQWMLADSEIELRAARLLVYQAAARADRGLDIKVDASACKVFGTETAGRIVDRCIQVLGGMGVAKEMPLERWYREMRIKRIGEGPSEVHRMVVARDLLGGQRKH